MTNLNMTQINWDDEAQKALMFVNPGLLEAHRETIVWHGPSNTLAAFDNDWQGIEEQIEILEQYLMQEGDIRATSQRVGSHNQGSGSFVVLIESKYPASITDRLWQAYWYTRYHDIDEEHYPYMPKQLELEYENTEREIASKRLSRREFEFDNSLDQLLMGQQIDPIGGIFEILKSESESGRHLTLRRLEMLAEQCELEIDGSHIHILHEAIPNIEDWRGRSLLELLNETFPGMGFRGRITPPRNDA